MINIAFFSEVREPFLGDEDPTASVKLAFSELDIPAKITEIYPKTPSKEPSRPSSVSSIVPEENFQTAATVPDPRPAATQPVIAEKFKPIVPEQKPLYFSITPP